MASDSPEIASGVGGPGGTEASPARLSSIRGARGRFKKGKPGGPGAKTNEEKRNEPLTSAMIKAIQASEFPDLKSIICAFVKRAGGADGVARMLWREYKQAKQGSIIRSQILQMILQGSKAISQKESAHDTSLLSEEEINNEIEKLFKDVGNSGKFAGAEKG